MRAGGRGAGGRGAPGAASAPQSLPRRARIQGLHGKRSNERAWGGTRDGSERSTCYAGCGIDSNEREEGRMNRGPTRSGASKARARMHWGGTCIEGAAVMATAPGDT
eukprot:355969-Chlamydomonas_euryale.AAC.3